jgi:hypothetical protein
MPVGVIKLFFISSIRIHRKVLLGFDRDCCCFAQKQKYKYTSSSAAAIVDVAPTAVAA